MIVGFGYWGGEGFGGWGCVALEFRICVVRVCFFVLVLLRVADGDYACSELMCRWVVSSGFHTDPTRLPP